MACVNVVLLSEATSSPPIWIANMALLCHGVPGANGFFYNLTVSLQARYLSQGCLWPFFRQQCSQLLRLRILVAVVVHGGRNPFHQIGMRQSVFQCAQRWFNQAIART